MGEVRLSSDDREIVRKLVDGQTKLEEAAITTADFWRLLQNRTPSSQCVQQIVDHIEDAIAHAPGYWLRPGLNRSKWTNSDGHWTVKASIMACQRLLAGSEESEVAESLARAIAAFSTTDDVDPSRFFDA